MGTSGFPSLNITEHQVPPGATVKDVKQCENCIAVFVRSRCFHPHSERCGCQKYCANCIGRVLLPVESDFETELRTVVPKLAKHAIRYDDSLLPKVTRKAGK